MIGKMNEGVWIIWRRKREGSEDVRGFGSASSDELISGSFRRRKYERKVMK